MLKKAKYRARETIYAAIYALLLAGLPAQATAQAGALEEVIVTAT